MMQGQVVAVHDAWALPARRPAFRLQRHCVSSGTIPRIELASRIAMGSFLGAAFGTLTAYPGIWVALGAAAAAASGYLRDRAASRFP